MAVATSVAADEIRGSSAKVFNWEIAAYDANGHFSHCVMATPYKSGITMFFSISRDYTWRVAWAHPSWKFAKGQSVEVAVSVDGIGPFTLNAVATGPELAIAELPPKGAIFDVMRKGYMMTVQAVGNTYRFDLEGTYAALTEVLSCVGRYGGSAARPSAPAPLVPAEAPSKTAATAEQRLEATKVVANILAQGEMTNFRILSDREVADLKSSYFSGSDVVWKAEGVVGTLRIVPKHEASRGADIASGVVSDDMKACKGTSASGTTKDDKSSEVVRVFTACKDGRDSWENRYTVVPVADGAHYLFTMSSLQNAEERFSGAAKADAMLREAVYQVIKK